MITITFTSQELNVIKQYAKNAELGGKSNIRTKNRQETLSLDQLTGQCGEAALSKLFTGNLDEYIQSRDKKDKTPWIGDGGSDLLDMGIDVKTSRMRAGKNFLYHLWVRPKEYHPKTIYYLALMEPDIDDEVHFIGWVQGQYLKFKDGRYYLRMDELNNMLAGIDNP